MRCGSGASAPRAVRCARPRLERLEDIIVPGNLLAVADAGRPAPVAEVPAVIAPCLDTTQVRILHAPLPAEPEIAYVPPDDTPNVQAAIDAAFAEMAEREEDRLLSAFVAELPDDDMEEDLFGLFAHKADTPGPDAADGFAPAEGAAHAGGGFASGGD
ncbi:MAG: hypothetical protein K2W96_16970, partial [Gemmataceae bacterium]|nr:hypothetical protein [Gemmataceae bacterium]